MSFGINFFDTVLKSATDFSLLNLHTCLPGTVTEFDEELKTCSVQPSIMRKYKDGEVISLPIINEIQVVYPRSGNRFIYFPLKKGDRVLLVFSERSLDNWKISETNVEAGSDRKFDLSDAFAIPGGYPETSPLRNKSQGLEITNGESYVSMNDEGNVRLKSENSINIESNGFNMNVNSGGRVRISNSQGDLIRELIALIDALISLQIQVPALGAPTPFLNLALPNQILNIQTIKTRLEALSQ